MLFQRCYINNIKDHGLVYPNNPDEKIQAGSVDAIGEILSKTYRDDEQEHLHFQWGGLFKEMPLGASIFIARN